MIKGRIFLVEDEVLVRLDISQQLVSLGHEVVGQASSGEDSLLLIAKTRPHLVLMDITIAGKIDGIETALRLPEDLQVAVIFLTSYSDDATRNRAGKAKPSGYLLKPVPTRDLKGTIESALRRRASLQAIRAGQDQLHYALDFGLS